MRGRVWAEGTKNFAINAAEAQIFDSLFEEDGSASQTGRDLATLDDFFTIIFAVELSINMFSHWFRNFFSDGWNIFDLVVVSVSLVSLGPLQFPTNVIRSLRALRIIRLFRRFEGLKNIVSALAASVLPVSQALLILLIVASICEKHIVSPLISAALPSKMIISANGNLARGIYTDCLRQRDLGNKPRGRRGIPHMSVQ
jgi:hypothetical protein